MGRQVAGMSAVCGLLVLACFTFCWASCSAASLHIEDVDRKPWMDEMESNLQNDVYLNELVSRLRALNDAEVAGLAQYEIDNYFRKHVPFFHLYNRVPATPVGPQSVLAGKRGFDFGLGRGFSATQAAKHKMGLEAAAFPSGPGRRRRSLEQTLRH